MKLEIGAETTTEEMVDIIRDLEGKLKKKTEDLTRTRNRLNKSRNNVRRMKEIIAYQRQRIIQLYEAESKNI
jgi:hypothetical protein